MSDYLDKGVDVVRQDYLTIFCRDTSGLFGTTFLK